MPPISQGTVSKIEAQFREVGHVKPLRRKPTFVDEDEKLNALLTIAENPTASLRQVGRENDISHTTVLACFKNAKLHPYKLQYNQELTEDDPDRRLQFCEQMMDFLDRNITVENIIFTDESTFTLTGEVNRQNCRYWAANNPHWMRETHTQHPQKVNVWAGIVNERILGPIFLDTNMNGERYLALLRDELVPALAVLYPNPQDPDIPNDTIWFQQDGAPAHYARQVREYLDDVFPNRWIGRRGFLEWPARSPDLTPLDFFLWGYLKNKVYKTKPQDLDDLKERITREIREITPDILYNVRGEFYHRLGVCQQVHGEHFEYLLR